MLRKKLRYLRYSIEAFGIRILFFAFRVMPIHCASALAGWIGRYLGPLLPISARARANLAQAMPHKTASQQRAIIADMWENLARVAAEYPHLSGRALSERTVVEGLEHLRAVQQSGVPHIFFSGHFANWEMLPKTANDYGMPLLLVYRHSNNPFVEHIVQTTRAHYHNGMLDKESSGHEIVQAIRKKLSIGMLVDQKTNTGIPVPFFGRPAMTSPTIARLALKYNIPLVPAYVRRVEGSYFRITIEPAIHCTRTGDIRRDVERVMTEVNATLERWIRAYPEQWLWVHRRWPNAPDGNC